ncbi:MAG: zf-HC2 domain-containing protein [bacterium]|nr:zf-HC2 domain-containing protein [bacterium]
MRCSKAQSYLSQELDEQLPADVIGDLDRHLDVCSDCREYRADLVLGQRLLTAAEPELPENFDWKLQLRLNQALRESAGEHLFPWQEEEKASRWGFLRGFGTAVPVGLAAVLALAMMLGPQVADGPGIVVPSLTPAGSVAHSTGADETRRTIYGGNIFGSPVQTVSGNGGVFGAPQGSVLMSPGWDENQVSPTGAILYLQSEARRLRTENFQLRREIQEMQTRLDTVPDAALDLQESR